MMSKYFHNYKPINIVMSKYLRNHEPISHSCHSDE